MTAGTHVWALSSDGKVAGDGAGAPVRRVLDQVRLPALAGLVADRQVRDATVWDWCRVSRTGHGGPQLSAEVCAAVGAAGASLAIDVYHL